MKRRLFVLGGSTLLGVLCAPPVLAAQINYNDYVDTRADRAGVKAVRVKVGQTWTSIFGAEAEVARYYNRQNLQLETGQLVLIPPIGSTTIMSPHVIPGLPLQTSKKTFVLVSPSHYAWGLFKDRQLVRWGPAVCGGNFCQDVGRSCRSPTGTFSIKEVAGPDRRSGSYPKLEAAEGNGALMPYFMRITEYGVGLHARYIRGRHETHGCIGMFYDDAKWLNEEYASKGGGRVIVARYV